MVIVRLSASILFRYDCKMGELFYFELGQRDRLLLAVCYEVMYFEHDNVVVFLLLEVFVDFGSEYVFHVCWDLC